MTHFFVINKSIDCIATMYIRRIEKKNKGSCQFDYSKFDLVSSEGLLKSRANGIRIRENKHQGLEVDLQMHTLKQASGKGSF